MRSLLIVGCALAFLPVTSLVGDPPPTIEILTDLARAASTQERRAMEAEREAVAMYRAYLMRDQVGEEFEGVVSAVTSFGAFVEIEEPYVEGLIKIDSLGNEPFDYDEVHMRLSGRKTGRSIELGDKVKVEINNVSVIRRRIDFTLIAIADQKQRPRRPETKIVTKHEAARKPDLGKRKIAAREVQRAATAHTERGSERRGKPTAKGGKLRLGVSHRSVKGGKKTR